MELNISLAPSTLFNIGSFPVTNTFLWMVVISLFLIIVFVVVAKRMKEVPGKIQSIIELLIGGGYDFAKSIIGSDEKTKRAFPLVFTMFIFVLVANLATFIPGQAAVSLHQGENIVSVFRAVMSDYGLVLMMTLISVIIMQIVAVAVSGPFGYIGKFIKLTNFKEFFKQLGKKKFKPGLLAQGGLDFFLGIMDIISEVAKIVSLSFRLFGNIFAGEVLGSVMLFLMPWVVPLPFLFLGLLTACVQAFVFAVLTLVFISMASEISKEPVSE